MGVLDIIKNIPYKDPNEIELEYCMKKYFHELKEPEFQELVDSHMTYAELERDYPQPKWCGYPNANQGVMGCWSLVGFMVTGEEYCKECDCYQGNCTEMWNG